MGFKDNYDFEQLVNEAERLVIDELEKQVEHYPEKLCLCEDCVLDMATLALNSIKPLYRVSLLGSLYAAHAMDEASYAESVKKAVAAAIEKVRENPSHD
ncbi:MAG: late competence development ComFB family protein [Termitinemataceae bacterium]